MARQTHPPFRPSPRYREPLLAAYGHQPSDNWLEIEASAQFLGRLQEVEIAEKNFVYSGLYRIVLADWNALAELYGANGLSPSTPRAR